MSLARSHDGEQAELDALLEVVARRETPRDGVEARLRALEDRQAIRDLIMAYGYLCDARRWDELLELYTDDIERVLGGTLVERVQGKAALREKLEAPTLARKQGSDAPAPPPRLIEGLQVRHLMSSEVIRLADDGTSATAAVQYALVATADGPDGFRRGVHEGSYVFDFRQDAGQWKFCRQLVISDNARNPLFQQRAT